MKNIFVLFLTFHLFGTSAFAFQSAISGATAQSGRAAVEASDTPFINPAGLPHLNGYYFSSTYAFGSFEPEVQQKDYTVLLSDNMKDTVIPTALGFNETVTTIDNQQHLSKRFQLSFGQFVLKSFSLGLGISYQDDFMIERYKQTNASLGAMWVPRKDLAVALIFEDLVPQTEKTPSRIRQHSKTSAGVAYLYQRVIRMKADLISSSNNSFAKPTAAFGVESFLSKWVVIRAGTQTNAETENNQYTGGLGFIGPRFAANYAYMTDSRNNQARHAVDLVVPLW